MTTNSLEIKLQFPCSVKQTGDNEISIKMPLSDGPFFAQDAIESIGGELSKAEQDRLADDVYHYALGEAVRRSIYVVKPH